MPAVKKNPAANGAEAEKSDRVTVQLDKATADKADQLAVQMGQKAGASLGVTITVSRTDVIRSLIKSKHAEMEAEAIESAPDTGEAAQ